MDIREAVAGDHHEIEALTARAFEGKNYSAGNEAFIAQRLQGCGCLTFQLVAEWQGKVAGHIAVSPALVDGEHVGCYGIGPLAVCPSAQSNGIGTRLLKEAVDRLKMSKAHCCVLVGDPNFYSRLGFQPEQGLTYPKADAANFQSLRFGEDILIGEVSFNSAFTDLAPGVYEPLRTQQTATENDD